MRGEGTVTTPEQITVRRRRAGRPVQEVHKQPVTLRLDPEVLARWRASGKGWQTRAAKALALACHGLIILDTSIGAHWPP